MVKSHYESRKTKHRVNSRRTNGAECKYLCSSGTLLCVRVLRTNDWQPETPQLCTDPVGIGLTCMKVLSIIRIEVGDSQAPMPANPV